MLDRVPPHSIQAEQDVLACLLGSVQAVDDVRDVLKPEAFYGINHVTIYRSILDVRKSGKTPNISNVRDHLLARGELEDAGGYGYLVDLAGSVPSVDLAAEYAHTVSEFAALRDIIRSGQEIINLGFSQARPAEEMLGLAQAKLAGVEVAAAGQTVHLAGDVARVFLKNITSIADNEQDATLETIPSGFYNIDQMVDFDPQDLIILAARPAMGKTALALAIAVAVSERYPVFFSTMEMSKEQLMNRIVAMVAEIDAKRLKRGQLTNDEWDKVSETVKWVDSLMLGIDERPALTIGQLRTACRRFRQQYGDLRFILVDYLQLMTSDNPKASQADQYGQISKDLKGLAKEFGCPVLALSQLSRAVESRDDKRPLLADLRGSGGIEQDADVVMFIYRDEYYSPGQNVGLAEIIAAKNRKGPVGNTELYFDKSRTKFSDITFEQKERIRASQAKRP